MRNVVPHLVLLLSGLLEADSQACQDAGLTAFHVRLADAEGHSSWSPTYHRVHRSRPGENRSPLDDYDRSGMSPAWARRRQTDESAQEEHSIFFQDRLEVQRLREGIEDLSEKLVSLRQSIKEVRSVHSEELHHLSPPRDTTMRHWVPSELLERSDLSMWSEDDAFREELACGQEPGGSDRHQFVRGPDRCTCVHSSFHNWLQYLDRIGHHIRAQQSYVRNFLSTAVSSLCTMEARQTARFLASAIAVQLATIFAFQLYSQQQSMVIPGIV